MRTNKQSLIYKVLVLGLVALGMSACNQSNGGSPAGVNPLACLNNSCSAITNSPGTLISAQGTATSQQYGTLNIAWDLIGVSTQFSIYNLTAYQTYVGAIAFAGYLQVAGGTVTNGVSSMCGAPYGTYTLQATSQGQFQGGYNTAAFAGGTLAGTGPGGVPITVTVGQGNLYNNTDATGLAKNNPNNRIYAQIQITTVNNINCGLVLVTN